MGERAAYVVAQVGEADLGELARLRTAWGEELGDPGAEGFEQRLRDWWDRQGGLRRAWLARDTAGVAVAMGNATVFERMPRPGLPDAAWAYVGNVWVDPAHRRRGVGSLVMGVIIDWARQRGMVRVVLNPSEMAVPMYRSLGFSPATDLLRLEL